MAKKVGQRGKKVCPSCNELIAARKMTCDCGHVFQAKTKAAKKQATATATQPSLFADDDAPPAVQKARQLADKYAKRVTLIEAISTLDQQKKDLKAELEQLEKELKL
ncbi:MAG: hypothetical protein H8E62_05275 [Planctomycetes bacterium]|nr:hypothetical protein [Planctomycetota bacterium]